MAAHLARMLASRGLKDSPLFTVNEAPVDDAGLLAPAEVADIRSWLISLAEDSGARDAVVRQTLDGTVRSLARQAHVIADAANEQVSALEALREAAAAAYADAEATALAATSDGTLLRGEVAARWREFVGTGELLKSLDSTVSRIRDRVVSAVKGAAQQADRVSVAVEAGLELMIVDHAETAAAAAHAAWDELGFADSLMVDSDLGRASRDLRRRAEGEVRAWQHDLTELVKAQGTEHRSARYLAYGARGLAVTLTVVSLGDDADTGDSGVSVGRTLLDAVFGADHTRTLVEQGRAGLRGRVSALLEAERARYLGLLDAVDLPADAALQLRAAARRVDDRRFEQARGADDVLS